MNRAKLLKVFRNVRRTADNGNKFPPDLTAAEKDDLLVLMNAMADSGLPDNPEETLSDAFSGDDGFECRFTVVAATAA